MNEYRGDCSGLAGDRITALVRSRLTLALSLTALMIAIYCGFMALFAFDKPSLDVILAPGLSLGLLLCPLVIACAFILCCAYVAWANVSFDLKIDAMKR
jgi:uncharacterized membrane protein (DUF485 family)